MNERENEKKIDRERKEIITRNERKKKWKIQVIKPLLKYQKKQRMEKKKKNTLAKSQQKKAWRFEETKELDCSHKIPHAKLKNPKISSF